MGKQEADGEPYHGYSMAMRARLPTQVGTQTTDLEISMVHP